jgi:hypothetical protein
LDFNWRLYNQFDVNVLLIERKLLPMHYNILKIVQLYLNFKLLELH